MGRMQKNVESDGISKINNCIESRPNYSDAKYGKNEN